MTAGRYMLALALLAAASLLCLCLGTVTMSPAEVLGHLFGSGGGMEQRILLGIRLPRLLMALSVGASLSVSGVIFQAVLKNPLADPYITGVSGGAAFGAALAALLSTGFLPTALAAFVGSLAAVFAVYFLARARGLGSTSMVLSGVALSFMLSSGVLLLFSVLRSEEVHRVLLWLMGDLSIARYGLIARMGIFLAVLLAGAMLYHRQMDIISFGEEFASALGVRRGDVFALFWIGAMLAAVPVALAGVIGFVGLVVPHLARHFFGPRHLHLLPAAALGGGIMLALADAAGRVLAPPYEIPAGVITGFFGGIFFLIILVRRGGE